MRGYFDSEANLKALLKPKKQDQREAYRFRGT